MLMYLYICKLIHFYYILFYYSSLPWILRRIFQLNSISSSLLSQLSHYLLFYNTPSLIYFVYAAPTLWNALDLDIRLLPFDTFKKSVKAHLYLKYFVN